MLQKLDPVLHNQLRLGIVSILMNVDKADFNYLLEQTGATRGNISVQITKLKEANYIEVKKSFKGNFPNTACKITKQGKKAFEAYVDALKSYF